MLSCEKKNEFLLLQLELEELDKQISNNAEDEILQRKLIQVKQKLDMLHLDKARGAQTRARQKWIEEGERNTAYFCNLEKVRSKKKVITRLQKDSGDIIMGQNEIMAEQVSFYKALYNQTTEADNVKEEADAFIENETRPILNETDAASCEGVVTLEETSLALSKMKNGSSPGRDGLTTEFYKFFWVKIGAVVINSFNESFVAGELSFTQKQGVIALLHKAKGLDRECL